MIPYFVRIYQYGNAFHDFEWDSWLYSGIDFFFTFLVVSVNMVFVIAGFIDFQRRKCMMCACGALLEPSKSLNYDPIMRSLPTINLLCPESLHTWFLLRVCLMDLGRKYMNRIFIYSSTFLGLYLFYAIFLLLQFFEFISIQLPLVANVFAMFDIFFVLTCIISMLWFGAYVNDQYVKDKLQLVKIKQTLTFIKLNIDKVLDPVFNVPDGK
jgi:hypothetical protein